MSESSPFAKLPHRNGIPQGFGPSPSQPPQDQPPHPATNSRSQALPAGRSRVPAAGLRVTGSKSVRETRGAYRGTGRTRSPAYPAYPAWHVHRGPAVPYGYNPHGRPHSDKSEIAAGIPQTLLGPLGIGRFYVGSIGSAGVGIAELCTCGGLGLWAPIDGILFLTSNDRMDKQGRPLRGRPAARLRRRSAPSRR